MSQKQLTGLIMLAVTAWGLFLAVGAFRLNHNPWRPVMVMACVLGFLGFWGLMLWSRRSRIAREKVGRNEP
jgi:hypothetical protein